MVLKTSSAYECAVRLLARREHSVLELQQKMAAKGFADNVIRSTLQQLQAQGLQSDIRYAKAFIQTQCNAGWGPRFIQQKLQSKGISTEVIAACIEEETPAWDEALRHAWSKHNRQQPVVTPQARAKLMRYLYYRGFSHAMIQEVCFNSVMLDEDVVVSL